MVGCDVFWCSLFIVGAVLAIETGITPETTLSPVTSENPSYSKLTSILPYALMNSTDFYNLQATNNTLPDVVTTFEQSSPVTDSPETTEGPVEIFRNCPKLAGLDNLTQEEFILKLTDSCRYDRLIKPQTPSPLRVHMQIDLTHIESPDQLIFKSHLLVQLRWSDPRLRFVDISPGRATVQGEEPLRNKLWAPHIVVRNEHHSAMTGFDGKDVFIRITPTGEVVYTFRTTIAFYCWMNLKKFPFDLQVCEIAWASWAYNTTNMSLDWEEDSPFKVATNLHLTEFVLADIWTENGTIPAPFTRGGLSGNHSTVIFKFKIRREVGYYIMDYFLPSVLLVSTSWVAFWLQADAAPARVTLGTATMLSFITLNGGLTKNLPKVSYIKASEIWFLGCSCFIFCSLAEFAFVNVIWRRRKTVEMKKPSSKHILKGAITPSLARKQLRESESINSLYKTRSCSSLDKPHDTNSIVQNNYLTVHSFPSIQLQVQTHHSKDELLDIEDSVTTIPVPDQNGSPPSPTWTTMTPQEVANWIDRKSRIFFPITFLVFNLFYWSFVYVL